MRMTPTDALELQEKVKGGSDPGAVRKFVLLSAWRMIRADKGIPVDQKPAALHELSQSLEVEVVRGG